MTYSTNELSFDLPSGLKDRSINIFSLKDEGPSEFSLVISRVPLHEGQTVADYTSLQLKEMQAKMPAFVLLERSAKQVSGEAAEFVEFTWKAEAGTMHQRQVSFATPGRGLVLVFTGTCMERFTPEWAKAFDAAVASVKIGKA
jgi:hypothetical protein